MKSAYKRTAHTHTHTFDEHTFVMDDDTRIETHVHTILVGSDIIGGGGGSSSSKTRNRPIENTIIINNNTFIKKFAHSLNWFAHARVIN